MTEQSNGSGAKLAPPYFAWNAFLSILQRMATEEPPTRIDKSYLETQSGAMQTAILAGLRWLGLIDEGGRLTEAFKTLVQVDDAQRKQAVSDLLCSRYRVIVEMGTTNATQLELEEAFKAQFDTQGETRRKAVAFYLKAAQYAGLPVSRQWKTPRTTAPRSGRRKATSKRSQDGGPPLRSPDVGQAGNLRTRYVEMLMAKAESQDEPDAGLLDRIEAALKEMESKT